MVYIDNILDEQHVYIPRNDNQGSYESSYDKGYSDGYSDGIEDCESCPLQDKEVILTAVTETITADEGYAGIERVFVDGRQLAAEKYVEGYNDGEENGVQEQKGKLASTAFTQNGVYTREDGWNEVEVDVPLSGLLQQKVLGLESGDTSPWVVTPDSGYSGMTQVIVNDSGYGQGKYDDGYTSGSTDGYNQGYESGYTSGVTDGYSSGYTSGVSDTQALMTSTAFTQNDTYQNPSGWSSVTVNVPKNVNLGTLVDAPAMQELNNGYYDKSFVPSEGSSDGWGRVYLDLNYIIEGGKDEQKALLSSTAFTQNDTYQNPSGWSSVTVNVPKNVELGTLVDFIAMNKLHNGYYEATFDRDNPWTDGWGAVQLNTDTLVLEAKAEQKALLSSTAITQNGNYTREDGWSAVSVSVTPQLQGKNESLTAVTQTFVPDSGYVGMSAVTVDASALTQDYYDSGYTSGQTDGYSSGYTDGVNSGCTEAYDNGYNDGYDDGYQDGENNVYKRGNYLTFEAFESGGVMFYYDVYANGGITGHTPLVVEYSLNGGPWTPITSTSITFTSMHIDWNPQIVLSQGDIVKIKGTNDAYRQIYSNGSCYNHFWAKGTYVYGNIMSLIYGDDFLDKKSFVSGSTDIFHELFYIYNERNGIYTHPSKELVLPATALTSSCYEQMFENTSITKAPELPSRSLGYNCYTEMFRGCTGITSSPELNAPSIIGYERMFSGCTNLNYVKCLATSTRDNLYTTGWLASVSANGTFVKAENADFWNTGTNGIPSGWTVQNV